MKDYRLTLFTKDGCTNCKIMKNVLNRNQMSFDLCDYSNTTAKLFDEFGIKMIPTILLEYKNDIIKRFCGLVDIKSITGFIDKHKEEVDNE